jgi:2-polyprenyl-3-methyl-5-hydroxy-6-metoxy-1,4-benzoquinol methylase
MALTGWERIDLLLADVQGAEDVLLERAGEQLAKSVRFLLVSTHHHSISGDPLTHQKALARLRAAGAHVIAEHTVGESFSGDGLIAVSFDERDADLVVPVSRARASDSLYGEPEVELERAWQRADDADQRATEAEHRLEQAEQQRDALSAARAAARDQPSAPARSWTGRLAAMARRAGRADAADAPEQAVRWGYRYLFGREPEDDGIVRAHAEELGDWHQVRAYLMASPEYAGPAGARSTMSGLEPPMALDVDADPATTDALLDHIAQTWSQLGVSEPHYSVVTNEAFLRESFAANEADFYGSGAKDVERVMATFERNRLSPRPGGSWLELGCGVGRMTPSLAAHAGQLIAMDVSPAHLELARQHLESIGTDNVELRQLTHVKDLDALPDLDVFFSLIVLQHNPPPVMLAIIERVFARVAPGGLAFFQVPTYRHDYRFVLDEYLRTSALASDMEMHVLPQRDVLRAAAAHGLEPVEIWEDGSTGLRPGEVSNSFLLHKP